MKQESTRAVSANCKERKRESRFWWLLYGDAAHWHHQHHSAQCNKFGDRSVHVFSVLNKSIHQSFQHELVGPSSNRLCRSLVRCPATPLYFGLCSLHFDACTSWQRRWPGFASCKMTLFMDSLCTTK